MKQVLRVLQSRKIKKVINGKIIWQHLFFILYHVHKYTLFNFKDLRLN